MDGGGGYDHGGQHDGGRPRIKNMKRPAVDYTASIATWVRNRRPFYQSERAIEHERPSPSFTIDSLPPSALRTKAVDAIPVKQLHSSLNKVKHPVNVVKWTPDGRRLLTGSTSGEFTLWNGISWNFETIMQAHDSAVRAVAWSHNDDWLISAEQAGIIKYWQPNFNNVKSIQAHDEPVRDLAFAPSDSKFITASDDATLKIFDFAAGAEEAVFTGHQWDAKCVDWHPTKGLVVSGSKDHQVKLWDPRTGRCLTTLHGHKNTVSKTLFEPSNGVLLASCARDSTARVFDIRMMRDVFLLRGHEKEIATLTWHPFYASLLSTGGADGALHHYLLDEQNLPAGLAPSISPYDAPEGIDHPAQTIYPAHQIPAAHDFSIWSLDWHPLGHVLASGSNDRFTRFWSRPKPGDNSWVNDRWHIGQAAAEAQGTWKTGKTAGQDKDDEAEVDDEADGLVDQGVSSSGARRGLPGLPGLPGINASLTMPFTNGSDTDPAHPSINAAFPPPPLDLPFPLPPHLAGGPSLPGMPPLPFPPGLPNTGSGAPALPPLPPGVDIEKLKAMFGGAVPVPPPGSANGPAGFPSLPPGFPSLPPGFPAGPPPPGFPPPLPGMPLPPGMMGAFGGVPGLPDEGGGGRRSRAPLPSQSESLARELKAGTIQRAR